MGPLPVHLGFLNCKMNRDEPKSNQNDVPPSYMEAVTEVQLSPRELLTREQLTQVMVDQQWRNLENNTTNQDTDQLIVPQKKRMCKKKRNGLLSFIVFSFVVIVGKIIMMIVRLLE